MYSQAIHPSKDTLPRKDVKVEKVNFLSLSNLYFFKDPPPPYYPPPQQQPYPQIAPVAPTAYAQQQSVSCLSYKIKKNSLFSSPLM